MLITIVKPTKNNTPIEKNANDIRTPWRIQHNFHNIILQGAGLKVLSDHFYTRTFLFLRHCPIIQIFSVKHVFGETCFAEDYHFCLWAPLYLCKCEQHLMIRSLTKKKFQS